MIDEYGRERKDDPVTLGPQIISPYTKRKFLKDM